MTALVRHMDELTDLLNFEDVLFKNFFQKDSFFDSIFRTNNIHYPVNIKVDENHLFIDIAAVGLDKKDINIETKDDLLKISYNKEKAEKEAKMSIHEGIAQRSFNFGWRFTSKKIKIDKLSASMDKGLLSIKIPIKEKEETIDNFKKIIIK